MWAARIKRILTVLCVAPLVAACGILRPATTDNRRISMPEKIDSDASRHCAEYCRDVNIGYKVISDDLPHPMVDMHFQPIEYQHVKYNPTNPLPTEGLKIDLDKLRCDFTYPLEGKFISDYGMRRGRRHTGIDIKAAKGDTIRAAMAGVVRMSKPYSSYGNIVVIRHYNGLETVYAHNTKNLVEPDQVVCSGQPIALAGRTGRSTTEHLHFEVRAEGEPLDPKLMVDPEKMTIREGWLYVSKINGSITAATSESEIESLASAATAAAVANDELRADAILKSEQKPAAPELLYHIVKKGEVLGTIARKYSTTVSRLCTLNGLKSPDRIREGQRLKIR